MRIGGKSDPDPIPITRNFHRALPLMRVGERWTKVRSFPSTLVVDRRPWLRQWGRPAPAPARGAGGDGDDGSSPASIESCVSAVREAKRKGRRIIAIGTTVVRALEAASSADGSVRPGEGIARGRIGRGTRLRIVDAILTGVHQPGESHFDLMKAFANDDRLARIGATAEERGCRSHEFGDSLLIERGEEAA